MRKAYRELEVRFEEVRVQQFDVVLAEVEDFEVAHRVERLS